MAPAADPAPLGLAAFALTTFLLSAANAGWMTKATGDAWLGFAFACGGVAQLLAGMWEFRNRNVSGATAFGTYGSFWIGAGAVGPPGRPHPQEQDRWWWRRMRRRRLRSGTIKFGGYIGILTALVAWYASAAGVANGMRGTPLRPVGKPFAMGSTA